MNETQAAATGRLWDNVDVQGAPVPGAVWRGNMAYERHRAEEYLKRWARGLFTENYNLKNAKK